MHVAFDFGISNTDLAIFQRESTHFHTFPSDTKDLTKHQIEDILKRINISLDQVELIGVTGGKSSDLDDVIKNTPIEKINEIDAIGQGAKTLYGFKDESYLVVSAGTGTACVNVQGDNFYHLGGIAVGGGMLEGLGHLLFNNGDGGEINHFAEKGLRGKLDFLIGDVVNKIGGLAPDLTAVNFGQAKIASANTIENTSAALCNMIGEVIGTIAYLNALLIGSKKVCFLGRTSYLSMVIHGIENQLKLAGIEGQYTDKREYGNVIGVLDIIKNKR